MYGSETIKPVYPAILIATNKNSPGDSCNNLMFFAGISRKFIIGFITKKLTKIDINIE